MGHGTLIVLDTHALVWWLADAPELSTGAKRVIQAAAAKRETVASTISVLEIATAVRRERLVLNRPLDEWLADVRVLPGLRFEPVSVDIAAMAGGFGRSMPGDPADRVILATAATLGARLVSADTNLQNNGHVDVVW